MRGKDRGGQRDTDIEKDWGVDREVKREEEDHIRRYGHKNSYTYTHINLLKEVSP